MAKTLIGTKVALTFISVVSVGRAVTSLNGGGYKTAVKYSENYFSSMLHDHSKEKLTRCDTTWIVVTGFTPAYMASG